ncbi:hypothetical protein FRB99_004716 [Tulasnella sp. 403]|nr:hypothetical protein FRB99_004716 [Tulasnella sp. 403]
MEGTMSGNERKADVPVLAVRQATLELDALDLGTTPTPVADEQNGDTLAPLAHPVPKEMISIVQPGAYIKDVASDLPGELHIHKVVCQGGYSDVSKGNWIAPDGKETPVAVKTLRRVNMKSSKDEEAKKKRINIRLRREAIVWGRLDHPNILSLIGIRVGNDDREPTLIAPWCENGNLEAYLEDHTELTIVDKIRLLQQTGKALEYLHTLEPPIVHGDIKPSNVLIKQTKEACLCDFGLARLMQSLDAHTGLTTSGGGQGTKGYMAPEIYENDSRSDKTDIFAFGSLMLAVLSGKSPYQSLNLYQTTVRTTKDEGDPYAKLQINYYRRSEEEVQDLRFAPLVGVDDDALLHVKSLDTPGVIRLETYRARNLGRNHQSFKRSVNEGEVVPNDRVHERGKKAMSHITQLGPTTVLGQSSCSSTDLQKETTLGILQAQGIMPPPEPEKSPSPEDLEEGTQSVEDLREIQEKKAKLADRLRAIKAEQEELDLRETLALSQASGAKVKQEDASQSTKRRPFGQAKQPEVIDLTLEYAPR